MPVQRVGPDAGGTFYNAIGTAEWQGAEGEQLRAAGWTYAGYGTWGVYLTAPGPQFPVTPGGGGGPYILPLADPGGYSGGPAPTVDPGTGSASPSCSSCRGSSPGSPYVAPRAIAGTAPAAAAVVVDQLEGIPSWIWWVLVVLALVVLLRG